MVVTSTIYHEFASGDDYTVVRDAIPIPANTTMIQAWFMVKRRYTDTNSDALISKTITTSGSSQGIISNTGELEGEASVLFTLLGADTKKLTPLSAYPYVIQFQVSDLRIMTYEVGHVESVHPVRVT